MTRRAAFIRGVLAGIFLIGGAQAVHLMLTPHSAGTTREVMVWIQLVLCIAGIPLMMHGVPGEVQRDHRVAEPVRK